MNQQKVIRTIDIPDKFLTEFQVYEIKMACNKALEERGQETSYRGYGNPDNFRKNKS